MPLLGSGTIAADLMAAAEAAVAASWRALDRQLSPDEQVQMKNEIRAAGLNALFTHMGLNAVVVGTAAGVTAGAATAVVVGAIT